MSSEKVVYQPPCDEKILQGSSRHTTEKETYRTTHDDAKKTVIGYRSPIQFTPVASRRSPTGSIVNSPRELPSVGGSNYNSRTSHNEIDSNYSLGRSISEAPATPASSGRAKTPTRSGSITKCVMALVTMLAILAIVLVQLSVCIEPAHAAECVPSFSFSASTGPIIAVMGATGTGKSSLIRDLQGRDNKGCLPKIGHGLQSCKHYP